MLDLGSGVAGGAHDWVAGRAGLWGIPPNWVWVVGFSPQILEHPTSICDTGVKGLVLQNFPCQMKAQTLPARIKLVFSEIYPPVRMKLVVWMYSPHL